MNARTQTLASISWSPGPPSSPDAELPALQLPNAFLRRMPTPGRSTSTSTTHRCRTRRLYKDVPGFLLEGPQIPRRTRGDEMVEEAERHFAAGKQAYAIGAFATARQEFDLRLTPCSMLPI